MTLKIEVGDFVTRKSYNRDIYFRVDKITSDRWGNRAILRGIDVRLCADAPLDDLEKLSTSQVNEFRLRCLKRDNECMKKIYTRRNIDHERFRGQALRGVKEEKEYEIFEIPGQVLHIDGDKEYLDLCLTTYTQLHVKARGFCIPEDQQAEIIQMYLKEYTPDILVVTGHDGLIKGKKDFKNINNYRNSKNFVKAVRKAREYDKDRDDLIIFAGACQSHYEALIAAGANFASSPQRIFIHAFDPVFIVEKLAYTSIHDTLSVKDIIENTITGLDGVGGIETRGKLRLGLPKSPY